MNSVTAAVKSAVCPFAGLLGNEQADLWLHTWFIVLKAVFFLFFVFS